MTAMAVLAAASVIRLAIYYGYPSLVEHSDGDVARAAAVLASYDVIVLGDGLELEPDGRNLPLDGERRKLPGIIGELHARGKRPQVFGYVDLGRTQNLSLVEIDERVARWGRAGVDGVFFDESGADFGVTAARRDAAVADVHARGLVVFMNAFNPDDLFEHSSEAPSTAHLGPGDGLLIESFAVRNGMLESHESTTSRAAIALRHRNVSGVRVFGVTTAASTFDGAMFAEARRRAAELHLDGFGWGEPGFSAVDSRLPWRGEQ